MAEQAGQQYIMREGGQVTRGREAQTYNIMAAMAVAGSVATTLGPRGMDKMLVDSTGDIIVTNDGATILRKMDIQHPAAKMIVEVAKAQDQEAGDGTTTAVIFAGELLRQAGLLTDKNLHESSIIKGYQMAAEKALELVKSMAIDVSMKDTGMLRKIAATAMTGKDTDNAKDFLATWSSNVWTQRWRRTQAAITMSRRRTWSSRRRRAAGSKSPASWRASWSARAGSTSRCPRS